MPSSDSISAPLHNTMTAASAHADEPFYLTATFWKRFAVVFSIILSAASLVLSAIASLRTESADVLRALTISGIVVNSVSISLSALTSLDWQKQATHDKQFAAQLSKVTHIHEGGDVVVTGNLAKGSP